MLLFPHLSSPPSFQATRLCINLTPPRVPCGAGPPKTEIGEMSGTVNLEMFNLKKWRYTSENEPLKGAYTSISISKTMALFDFFWVSSISKPSTCHMWKVVAFCRKVSLRALIQGPWIQGFLIRPTNNHSFVVFFGVGGWGGTRTVSIVASFFFSKKTP